MPIQDTIIGVDLDGVCSDFYARMREIAAEWFECKIEDLTPKVSYGLPEWGIKDKDHYESLGVQFVLTPAAMVLLMGTLWALDHRFHCYTEGWQSTRKTMIRSLRDAYNDPSQDVTFPRYDTDAEGEARRPGLHFWLYLILTAGGPVSFGLLSYFQ